MNSSITAEPNITFQAYGLIKGIYQPGDDRVKGTLVLEDGTAIEATIIKYLRRNVLGSPDSLQQILNKPLLWKTYPKTNKQGHLSSLGLIGIKSTAQSENSEINRLQIRGIIVPLKDNINKIGLEIRSLIKTKKGSYPKSFTVVITGDTPIVQPNQFWSVQTGIDRGSLKYISGECIVAEYNPEDSKQAKSAIDAQSFFKKLSVKESGERASLPIAAKTTSAALKVTGDEAVIMIDGRIPELSIKFSTRPDLPETGKKVTLQITGENGIVVRASINRKTLKKQVEKMDSFDEWVGVLSGKMSQIGTDGIIELGGAGMTVFEKKSKPPASPQPEAKETGSEQIAS